jgi:hypothetical protein
MPHKAFWNLSLCYTTYKNRLMEIFSHEHIPPFWSAQHWCSSFHLSCQCIILHIYLVTTVGSFSCGYQCCGGTHIWDTLCHNPKDHNFYLITTLHVAETVHPLNTLIRNITLNTESWTKNVWTLTHLADWNSGKMCCLLSFAVVWVMWTVR